MSISLSIYIYIESERKTYICIYTYIYIYIYMCISLSLYIYRERERCLSEGARGARWTTENCCVTRPWLTDFIRGVYWAGRDQADSKYL